MASYNRTVVGLTLIMSTIVCLATGLSEFDHHSGPRKIVRWPRGSSHACGTLRSPGSQFGVRHDETDHCFPASASDHMVCCIDIQNVDNSWNTQDSTVARYNPLSGPIRRNSDPSSYSWCTCSESICTQQLHGRVAWIGKLNDQVVWKINPPAWYFETNHQDDL